MDMQSTAGTIQPEDYVDERGHYAPYDYWLSTCGLYEFYDKSLAVLGDISGKKLIDCGCGIGHTAVMFAKRDAEVTAFDVDQDNVDKARALAAANGVAVDVSRQDFEAPDYPEASFDLAFGSCVIHHVDGGRAGAVLGRLLKPGGRAVFIENSARNPVLMLARRHLVGTLGIPKYGDDEEEHPLTKAEIQGVRDSFPGRMEIIYPSLVLFRLIDFYITRRRWRGMTAFLRGLDDILGRIPWLKPFGYFQIIILEKHK